MDVKDTAAKIIKALVEIAEPTPRQLLMDFVMGKKTNEIEARELDELETYGIGEMHEEDDLAQVIDVAIENGLIKQKSSRKNELAHTAAGKKFAKKPTALIIPDGDELSTSAGEKVEEVVLDPMDDLSRLDNTSSHTKHQVRLIQAIDRKVALDDFASNEALDLDDVLDDLESLVRQGRALDVTYFTDEVMGADCVQELIDFFESSGTDNLDAAMKEFDDLYKVEEIRLARVVYRVNKMK